MDDSSISRVYLKESLGKASEAVGFVASDLRAALRCVSGAEAIVVLGIIEAANELQRRIEQLGGAVEPESSEDGLAEGAELLQVRNKDFHEGRYSKVRIVACSVPHAWYADRVGSVVSVFGVDRFGFWTRDTGPHRFSQWVALPDAKPEIPS
jgi:hypothetical protein